MRTINQADLVVQLARNEVGKNPRGDKFWRWYGYSNRVSWCACFYSWVLYHAGLACADLREHPNDYITAPGQALISKGCVQILAWFMQHGMRLGDVPAKAGDIILYEWDPEHDTDGVDHVGIVEYVEGDRPDTQIIHTIEGNWGDNVSRRTVRYRDAEVWAICRPSYIDIPIATVPRFYLFKGETGESVELLQCMLINHGYEIEQDGNFGDETKNAVIEYQKSHGLEADGIVGDNTWTELLKVGDYD